MIVSNLMGGLGNQLFQYACGFALAARQGVELRLATDLFEAYALHQGFELARVFAIDNRLASPDDLQALLGPWRQPALRRLLLRLRPGLRCSGRAAFEPSGSGWPHITRLGPQAYLHGYWQTEHYFADQAPALRAALQFRQTPNAANARLLERIDNGLSVSLHLRRGDYVSKAKNRRIYANCGPAYYQAAMGHLQARHAGARFFVFSDDVAWARQALAGQHDVIEVVEHNRGAESWNDLRLMRQCRHHIIANSTFSWWAAWLGEGPGKTIIAPRQWYTTPGRDRDLVPERWLRL